MEFSEAELGPMKTMYTMMFQQACMMGQDPFDPAALHARRRMEQKFLEKLRRKKMRLSQSSLGTSPSGSSQSFEELEIDISGLYERFINSKSEGVGRKMIDCRLSNDESKICYWVGVEKVYLWDVDLVLTGETGDFCKDQTQPFELYKLSYDQALKSLYKHVKSRPMNNHELRLEHVRRTKLAMDISSRKQIRYKFLDMSGEFTAENETTRKATHLLALYSHADERFPRLAQAIKEWKSKRFDLLDKGGAFSSYAFMLMLIYYLQRGCQPPVLPCLHEDYPKVFKPHLDSSYLRNLDIKFQSENKQNLGHLIVGFFDFYSNGNPDGFNYRKREVSIRSSRPKSLTDGESSMFVIEDPITQKNCVKDVPYSGPTKYGELTKLATKNMSEILTELFALSKMHLVKNRNFEACCSYKFD